MIKIKKLKLIFDGWKNYAFENKEVEVLANKRAEFCAKCPFAVIGNISIFINDDIKETEGLVCDRCDTKIKCPISMKIRSINEKCPEKLW
jgi:hypothetical protein